MVSIFPNLCLWRRSLRSNVGGIDHEKLYRATLSNNDDDHIDDFKKTIGLMIKTTALHVHHAF